MRISPRALAILFLLAVPFALALLDRQGLEKASPAPLANLLGRIALPHPGKTGAPQPIQPEVRKSAASSPATAIFSRLFSRNPPEERSVLAGAMERFSRPYPAASPTHLVAPETTEVVSRLGLLKFLGRGNPSAEKREFFRVVATNAEEHWLVQRQALRNLRTYLPNLKEAERFAILGQAQPRAVALASQSETELLLGLEADLREERAPADSSDRASTLQWEQLPCPTAEEFVSLSARIHWNPVGAYQCGLDLQGKLGRLFFFLSRIDFGQPPEGAGPITKDLRRPFEFLERNVNSLQLDLLQETTIAYNKTKEKTVMLGSSLFELAPLEAMQVLIHEARHSYPVADSHYVCAQGDIPNAPGGCDDLLSDGEDAGAYSYGTFFYMKIAQLPGLAPADREFVISEALSMITRRFNRLPPRLAQFSDGILALDEKGAAHFLHPFARASFPVLQPANSAEAVVSLGFNPGNAGSFLFSQEGFPKTWMWGKPLAEFNEDLLRKKGIRSKFVGKLTLPNDSSGYPYAAFLDGEDQLQYLKIDTQSGKKKVFTYPLQGEGWVPRQFTSVAGDPNAVSNMSYNYILANDGRIFRVYYWGGDQKFNPVPWNNFGPFASLQPGVLFDSLFALNQAGQLYRQSWREQELSPDNINIGSDVVEYVSQGELSNFQLAEGAAVYREGAQLRGLLGRSGKIELRYFSDSDSKPVLSLPEGKIVDFTLFRLLATHGSYEAERSGGNLPRFLQNCAILSGERDPWLQYGIGLDGKGRLLVEGKNGECLPAALPRGLQGKLRSFRFTFREHELTQEQKYSYKRIEDRPFFFPPLILDLELLDGSHQMVRPYEGWRDGADSP